jgi:hypothetical protein
MRAFIAIIFIVNSAIGYCQSAEFSFKDKTTIKFPRTLEGQQLHHYFVFENTGNLPLIIQEANTSCPCAQAKFPIYPILPGQRDSILVTFDTNQKAYHQDRKIEIISNVKKKTFLGIKVYVIPKE